MSSSVIVRGRVHLWRLAVLMAAAFAGGWAFGAVVGRWLAVAVPVSVALVLAAAPQVVLGAPPASPEDAAKFYGLVAYGLTLLLTVAAVGTFAGVWWRQERMVAEEERRAGG